MIQKFFISVLCFSLFSCSWDQIEKSVKSGDGDGNLTKSKLTFWKPVGNPEPIESISFEPDDHRLTEDSQNK
ncbi:hypothetical protein [Leptospira noumeaensis]|uniref:hypothetical protein n=1 Tax=Leptospira noumeaensis TaxID=2484964 RepID=UPI001ABF619D|nr:hypothetical protein [Leptospira noumeaensis]